MAAWVEAIVVAAPFIVSFSLFLIFCYRVWRERVSMSRQRVDGGKKGHAGSILYKHRHIVYSETETGLETAQQHKKRKQSKREVYSTETPTQIDDYKRKLLQQWEKNFTEWCKKCHKFHLYKSEFVPRKLQNSGGHFARYGYVTSSDSFLLAFAMQMTNLSIIHPHSGKINVWYVEAQSPVEGAISIALTKKEAKRAKLNADEHSFESLIFFDIKPAYFSQLHNFIDDVSPEVVKKLLPSSEEVENSICKLNREVHTCQSYDKSLQVILNCSPNVPVLIASLFASELMSLLAIAAHKIVQNETRSKILIVAENEASVKLLMTYINTKSCQLQQTVACKYIQIGKPYPNENPHDFIHDAKEIDIKSVHVIITTLNVSQALFHKVSWAGLFSHIFINEEGHLQELEALGALCLARGTTKIIISKIEPTKKVIKSLFCEVIPHSKEDKRSHSLFERLYTEYMHVSSLPSAYTCHLVSRQFCCSNLEDSRHNEAEVVIKEVKQCLDSWPSKWGKQNRICVIAPSTDQYQVIRSLLEEIKLDDHVPVCTVREIQGKQFQAVFIFAGATALNNLPSNIIDAAITAAQYEVVAVGDPFLLLQSEDHVADTYQCWEQYIKQCLECNTLFCNLELPGRSQKLKALRRRFFPKSDSAELSSHLSDINRSTLPIAPNKSRNISTSQKKKRTLTSSQSLPREIPSPQKSSTKSLPQKRGTCKLSVESVSRIDQPFSNNSDDYILRTQTYYYAEAFAVNSDESRIVVINGLNSRIGAFDGDIVEVEIFPGSLSDQQCYGRVTEVKKRASSDLQFLCRVSTTDPALFYPTDRKHPGIMCKGNAIDKSTGDIIVYEDLGNSIIKHSEAVKMIFLVKFLKWTPPHRFPLGKVIRVLQKGYTHFYAEELLKVKYSVDYKDPSEMDLVAEKEQCAYANSEAIIKNAFTIDPSDAKNLDDAFSLSKSDDDTVYRFGIHITNAAKLVVPKSKIDQHIRKKGISVYSGEQGTKVMHMMPPKLRHKLSLLPGKCCNVLSVACDVHVQKDEVKAIDNIQIRQSVIKSVARLTYRNAQQIMDSEESKLEDDLVKIVSAFKNAGELSLKVTLKLLYSLSLFISHERLQSDEMYVYDCNADEDRSCWQAHKLVQELNIWANSQVAKQIYKHYPVISILRRQGKPSAEKLNEFARSYSKVMPYSLSLSHFSTAKLTNVDIPVIVPLSTLEKITEQLSSNNVVALSNLLSSDNLYPQLAMASSAKKTLLSKAEYCCNLSKEELYEHYSLHLEKYTHFTSPIRRYVDIVVQRMLIETCKSKPHFKPSVGEHMDLCQQLNTSYKRASRFEKESKILDLAVKFSSGSKEYIAFIDNCDKRAFELAFPELELSFLTQEHKRVRFINLGPFKSSHEHKGTDRYEWKVLICSMKATANLSNVKDTKFVKISDDGEHAKSNHTVLLFKASSSSSLSSIDYLLEVSPLTVAVQPNDWKQILNLVKKLMKNHDLPEKEMKFIKDKLKKPEQPGHKCDFELSADNAPFVIHIVSASLKPAETYKLWMSWRMGSAMIEPTIQLIELSPLFRVCVQHNAHPAECFSDCDLIQASSISYASMKEYVNLWKKVLLAEAAVISVKEAQPVIIRDVQLQWPGCETSSDGSYHIDDDPIIVKIPDYFTTNCFEYFNISAGDLVCIRYASCSCSTKAVFHLVVHKVTPINEEAMKIEMNFVSKSLKIPEDMKRDIITNKDAHCEVQVIAMTTAYRRIFDGLIRLRSADEERLVQKVAKSKFESRDCGRKNEKAMSILDSDALAHTLWTDDSQVLNYSQVESMKLAMKNQFQLIHGPPGTGKSVTGAHLAYIFALQNRENGSGGTVLYCGPSNKSVDVVLKQFNKTELELNVLRIYGSMVERNDFLGPTLSNKKVKSNYICPPWAQKYALHHKIRDKSRKNDAISRFLEIEEDLKQIPKTDIPSGKFKRKYREIKNEAEKKILSLSYDVVLCTCNGMSSARLKRCIQPTHCIIDECGMATEPETIVPISLSEHVVLIGDHLQLQPVIKCRQASEKGLATSLFQRYAENYPDYVHTLGIQYRMHEKICAFPSEEFYEGQLKTDDSVLSRSYMKTELQNFWPRGSEYPILFYNIIGEEEEDVTGQQGEGAVESKRNKAEAKKVKAIVEELQQCNVPISDLAVLTPYSLQKREIMETLKQPPAIENLKVSTIIESQGDEYGIVILSTVRSQRYTNREYIHPDRHWMRQNLGFVTDRHQINVGITRSKYGLIIVGNKGLLAYDETWKKLIEHYENLHCVTNVPEREVQCQ